MSADDLRKHYILTTAANFFSKETKEFLKHADDRHLAKFLDDLNVLMLVVNNTNGIAITTKLENVNSFNGKSLVFFKSKEDVVTPENMKTLLLISSIVDSPIDTLFYLLHSVYSPVIQHQQSHGSSNNKADATFDSKLSNNLVDLESNLKVAIRRHGDSSEIKRSALTPLDEFHYWSDMAEKAKTKENRERAAFFFSEFKVLIDFYKKSTHVPSRRSTK
jgi:hypothetical protein